MVDDVLVEGNLIDASEAPADAGGFKTIVGIAVNALNPTRSFRNVRVVGNTVIGSSLTAPFGRISYAAILVRGAPDVLVERNRIQRVNRGILLDYGASATMVRGNTLLSCGSGGTAALEIADSSNNVVIDNIMDKAPGDTVFSVEISQRISQTGTSRNNRIENNGAGKRE